MKIVVLDGYTENPGDLSWEPLRALGELTVYDRSSLTDGQEAIDRIGDAEVVLTNKTPITRQVLDACPGIKYIAILATGYNVVDVACCRERGIPVSNVPVYGTYSVSQFAIALLLEICHHIGHHSETVYQGKWEHCQDWCYWDYPLIELEGKTLGLIGLGNIGRHTAAIGAALGMQVIAYDAWQNDEGRKAAEYVELDDLFARADVIALHMPLLPFNTGIINKENIAKMKDGVIIINNSRGQMIVEQDLADALNSGKVAAAGLDVVSTEPIRGDNPLLKAKNCIITPHMSWGAKESRQRIMDCTVENVRASFRTPSKAPSPAWKSVKSPGSAWRGVSRAARPSKSPWRTAGRAPPPASGRPAAGSGCRSRCRGPSAIPSPPPTCCCRRAGRYWKWPRQRASRWRRDALTPAKPPPTA